MNASFISTDKLMKFLRSQPDELKKIKFDEVCTFAELLEQFREKSGISKKELVVILQLSKSHLYKIFDGTRIPSRDVILCLALILYIELDDVQRLLALARESALYPKIRRDAIIIASISQKLSVEETDELLLGMGEDSLL